LSFHRLHRPLALVFNVLGAHLFGSSAFITVFPLYFCSFQLR
jgi:hypothetical protein